MPRLSSHRADLCALEGVDQAALPDIGITYDADGDALGCRGLVRFQEAKEGRCGGRAEVGALGIGGGAEG